MRSDGKGGGQYLRIREGTSAFAEGLVKTLNAGSVKLSSAVAEVHQRSDGTVSIATRGPTPQTYVARRVIVSVPTPVYKTIKFTPALPAAKGAIVNRTRYGFYTKYIVNFREAFWTEDNLCGLAQSFVGPVSVFRDTSLGPDQPAMTCFLGGSFGRKWAAQDAEGKKASVLQQIGDVFAAGRDISGLVVDAVESPWMEEEFSGWGCPCANLPPGLLAHGWDALCAPFGHVFFVGTELSKVWRGYMEGAVRSGESGALQAIADLGAGKQPTLKL
ncbi:flavin-containing amine oxidase [Cladophialophora carrionii]|uniref:Amine oxidase n=1 Tax=Cladophialophora carrionii TaxID=86049 RepID=A0A1C1D2K0_9EURO|nr:flavin-containing amine oxidase [Cladophialophora carrionii]